MHRILTRPAAELQLDLASLNPTPKSLYGKWNAPSFRHAGEDRVTFRLQPGDKLQLIFHRGA
jgi:hypothetical protein